MNLTNHVRTARVAESQTAAQTDVVGTSTDLRTYHAVRYTALIGTVTAGGTVTLKAQGSDDNVNWADLADAEAVTDDAGAEGMLLLDLVHPRHRYVRPVIVRASENAQVDGIVADLYMADRLPVTHGDTVAAATYSHAAATA